MTYQYLTQFTTPYNPSTSARKTSITIHHWGRYGQTFMGVVNFLCSVRPKPTSAHYVVEAGRVACIGDPDRATYHCGVTAGNNGSIGIECRPEATDGDYLTVAELIYDLRKVYGDLPLKRHSDWKATACPGDWDLGHLDRLARSGKFDTTSEPPKPPVIVEDDEMISIARNVGNGEVWAGNGVWRRHLNPHDLADLQYKLVTKGIEGNHVIQDVENLGWLGVDIATVGAQPPIDLDALANKIAARLDGEDAQAVARATVEALRQELND